MPSRRVQGPSASTQPSRSAVTQSPRHAVPGSRTAYGSVPPRNVPVGGGPISVSVITPGNPQASASAASPNNYLGRTVTYGGHVVPGTSNN